MGRNLSYYRIIEMLGGSGSGVVYQAEDRQSGRFVAAKFIMRDAGNRDLYSLDLQLPG